MSKSISEVIRERRSIKTGFLQKEISEEDILSILEDAVWAPNHGLREPWRFIFVSAANRDVYIEKVLACHEKSKQDNIRKNHEDVPAFLIVLMDEDPRPKVWHEDFAAVSALIQNFQLLAWEKEIGTVWKTPNHIYDPKFRNALKINKGEKIVGILHIGYFDKNIAAKERSRTNPKEKFTSF